MSKYPNGDKVTTKKSESSIDLATISPCSEGISQMYQSSEINILFADHDNEIFHLYGSSSLEYGRCPYCGRISRRVHSRYVRTIQDLSILGRRVILYLEVRKFFCDNEDCRRKTFAEQPGDEVFRYRRRTCRCERTVARHGISVSSGSASRLLEHMGIHISPSTILREVHRMRPSQYQQVKEVGVEDWAWRKGVTYGSIIIDLKNGWPIDLLGDRETDSFHSWMEEHEQVCLVSRDRSTDYSSAIAALDKPIDEVADKFHLVKNAYDRFSKLIAENYDDYRQAVRKEEQPEGVRESCCQESAKPPEKRKTDSRDVMFGEVKELQAKGLKPTTISKKLGIARQTARKYCKMESLPPRNSKLRNEYYMYDSYVEQESARGRALNSIFKELRAKGFSGSHTPFYDHYKYLSDGDRGYRPRGGKSNKKDMPIDERSALVPIKSLTAITDKSIRNKGMTTDELSTMDTLKTLWWFREMYEAIREFYQVITGTSTIELIRWMKRHWKTGVSTLKNFITGIMKDFKAVRNTIRLNVTNGITEGYVNKLKAVKRVLYGRDGIKLLKRKLVMEHVLFN